MATCSWPIGNGQSLDFEIYDRHEGWNHVPGLYILACRSEGSWYALYIGQTDDFAERLPEHERLDEALQKGATHIHTKVVHQQARRNEWEKSLIAYLKPELNHRHYPNA